MDFRRLDLNLLLVLDALCEERSVTAVAKRLKVSQPTVSFSLNKLRAVLEDELFIRTAAGMQPTPRALELHEPVRRIIATIDLEILRPPEFNPFDATRTFTVAMSDIGEMVMIPALLERFRALAPKADLRSLSLPPSKLVAAMESGEVTLALGYFPGLKSSGLFQQGLFTHPFVALVRADHPTIGETLSLDEFLRAEHVVVSHEGRSQEICERAMTERGLSRRIRLHLMHFMTIPLTIANSDMIAVVPRAVGALGGIWAAVRSLEPPIEIPTIGIKQYWHKRFHNDPANRWLRSVVSDVFMNQDPTESATWDRLVGVKRPGRSGSG
jgi:DNA-binding transcriptional LysR family regulator